MTCRCFGRLLGGGGRTDGRRCAGSNEALEG